MALGTAAPHIEVEADVRAGDSDTEIRQHDNVDVAAGAAVPHKDVETDARSAGSGKDRGLRGTASCYRTSG